MSKTYTVLQRMAEKKSDGITAYYVNQHSEFLCEIESILHMGVRRTELGLQDIRLVSDPDFFFDLPQIKSK